MLLIKKQKVSEWALLCYAASIRKADVYSIFQIAQMMLIKNKMYRSGLC